MKLDVSMFRYLTSSDFRVLTAIELGMRNHEYVSRELVHSLSNLQRCDISAVLSNLLKLKLIHHMNHMYDGYKLTYSGYDIIALNSLSKTGIVSRVGPRMGVGKESDIHTCTGDKNPVDLKHRFDRVDMEESEKLCSGDAPDNGDLLCLKIHRLGRVSFKAVKNTRDYLKNKSSNNWMYISRLAALKEYAYMHILHKRNFPIPKPIAINRHIIVMEYIDGVQLNHVRVLKQPLQTLETLMQTIVQLASVGLIHGDFNEFNLMIRSTETQNDSDSADDMVLIDFPQIVAITHPNARLYFQRDVECVITFFRKRFGILVTDAPTFDDVLNECIEVIDGPMSFSHEDEDMLRNALSASLDAKDNEANGMGYDDDNQRIAENDNDKDGTCCDDDSQQGSDNGRLTETTPIETDIGTNEESCNSTDGKQNRNRDTIQIWTPMIKCLTEEDAKALVQRKKKGQQSKRKQRIKAKLNSGKNKGSKRDLQYLSK